MCVLKAIYISIGGEVFRILQPFFCNGQLDCLEMKLCDFEPDEFDGMITPLKPMQMKVSMI